MKKSLMALISTFLFGALLLNAQTLDEKILKQMKKDASGSYFSSEESLPENTLNYFNKKADEIGTIHIDSLRNRRLAYGISKKDSVIIYFDSLKILFGADYKKPKQPTPEDTRKYNLIPMGKDQSNKLYEIFGPVIREE